MTGADQLTSLNTSLCTSLSIGNFAFSDCTGITGSVDLSNCTSIGEFVFFGCNNLTLTISTQATTVGTDAFYACSYVTIQSADENALACKLLLRHFCRQW